METKCRRTMWRRVLRGVLAGVAIAIALALVWPAAAAWAQGVYKTPGAPGQAPVFSDKPLPGAREVSLPPLNVIESPSETQAVPTKGVPGESRPATHAPAAPAYRRLAIVFPENDGSVVANTAVFEVRLAVDPVLQIGAGHAFTVSLNGQGVGRRFTATEFMIPPEFWGDTLPPPNQRMQLDAAIVDREGKVLLQAAPVSFYLRHASRLLRPQQPLPLPLPQTRPQAPATGGGNVSTQPVAGAGKGGAMSEPAARKPLPGADGGGVR